MAYTLPRIGQALVNSKGLATKGFYDFFRAFANSVDLQIAQILILINSLGGGGDIMAVNGLFIQDDQPTPAYTGQKYLWFQSNAYGTMAKLWVDDGA